MLPAVLLSTMIACTPLTTLSSTTLVLIHHVGTHGDVADPLCSHPPNMLALPVLSSAALALAELSFTVLSLSVFSSTALSSRSAYSGAAGLNITSQRPTGGN